jgi:hypothetical protein
MKALEKSSFPDVRGENTSRTAGLKKCSGNPVGFYTHNV